MTKEKYMALADVQTIWTNKMKPWIVAGFIGMLASSDANAKNLVLADGTNIPQSTFQAAGDYIEKVGASESGHDNLLLADGTNIAQSTFIPTSEKGANNGVATLGADGKVPSSQLPSYVDDVIEAANFAALPAEGEAGKIYVTLNDNKTYRWGGSAYAEISASIALGETEGTAYEGSKGKKNADDIADLKDDKANKSEMDVTAGTGVNADKTTITLKTGTSATVLTQHQDISGKQEKITATGLLKGEGNGTVSAAVAGTDYQTPLTAGTDYVVPVTGKQLSTEDYTSEEKTKLAGIAAGAQVNVIETVKVNGTALTPDANKAVDVTFEIPERVSAAELADFIV
jgi:hypothetical protein